MGALEVAQEMVRRGFRVVPVKHADKFPEDPTTGLPLKGWQTLNIPANDLGQYFNGRPQNVGFLCGEPSGNLDDIDLDCDEAVALASHFLPSTAAIFGRASRLRSHWLYTCALASEKFCDIDGRLMLEIRSTGLQTVAPGSTHTSGEPIQWSPGYDQKPGVVHVDDLARAVSRLAAATILARHYPSKGGRHDFALHLAGGLLRAGWTETDVAAFVFAVALVGGSDDPESHRAAAKDTAEKIRRGENTSGWPSLAKSIGDAVVAKACDWLGCKATTEPGPDPWDTPIPFDDAGQLPPFPLHVLPHVVREWVHAEAEATQTPPDLAAWIALAVIAAAVQKKFELEMRPGWREPLSMYLAVSLPSGERKSAVYRDATAPIREWERDQAERMRAPIAAALAKRAVKEKKLAEAVRKAATVNEAHHGQEAEQLAVELAETRTPVVPRLFCDDTTPEKLNSLLCDHGGRMAVFSAEGGIFETFAGRYTEGVSNIDGLLKGHSGDELRVDRMNRPPLHVRRPAVTLAVCVQPDVIQGLAQKPSFRGRGLLARFLFILPQSRVGFRKVAAPSVPPGVTASYNALILRLLALPETSGQDGEIEATVLRLGPESVAAVERLATELEPKLAPGGELESIRDWASKSVGAVIRIAGLLHLASDSVDSVDSVARVGSVETPKKISEIHTYLLLNALGAFRVMGADLSTQGARVLLAWIDKGKLQSFTKREAHVALAGTFKRSSDLDEPLNVLTEHGYIREAKTVERSGPGRKPSPSFEINPCRHNQHNRQNQADSEAK